MQMQLIALIFTVLYNYRGMADTKNEEARNALWEMGYRLTPQRQLIVDALQDSEGHISAEEIHAQVKAKYPHVNISTVYRTLELLKSLGMVTETDFGGGRFRYHPSDKGHHHHLICEQCNSVIDIDEAVFSQLKRTLFKDYGFKANITHFAIFGRCEKCR
jgi:Fur family ferric uptake transcriptional regulator